MSNYAILRFDRIHSQSELQGRSNHNLRVGILAEHIDKSKTKLNKTLGNGMQGFKAAAEGKKMRKNGVLAVEALMSFSPEMTGKIDVLSWSAASIGWLEKTYGKGNILEVALHLDEETPHLHAIFLPRNKAGKWNWRGLVKGKVGLQQAQTSYAKSVEPFGLKRGEPKIGRHHVPTAIWREMEKLKAELEKVKEAAKTSVMLKEASILEKIEAFLGEEKFLAFLKWVKAREEKENLKKTLFKEDGPDMDKG